MHLAQCSGDADAQAQCAWQVGRSGAKDPVQRFAVGILEDEPRPPVLTGEGQRPHTPIWFRFGRERLFVLKPADRPRHGRSAIGSRTRIDRVSPNRRPRFTKNAAPSRIVPKTYLDRSITSGLTPLSCRTTPTYGL
jgi:hypothetical protein